MTDIILAAVAGGAAGVLVGYVLGWHAGFTKGRATTLAWPQVRR